jgi:hypothetical protein
MDNMGSAVNEEIAAAIGRKKIILLLRDPRDAAVSMYFHFARRSTPLERAVYGVPLDIERRGLFEFVMNRDYGMPRTIAFMNRFWEPVTKAPQALAIRYEDMRRDPEAQLAQVMGLLGAAASEQEIRAAARFASFENMKQNERDGVFRSAILRPGAADDEESYKVRKGEVGGFSEYFTADQLAEINAVLHTTLDPRIGYK